MRSRDYSYLTAKSEECADNLGDVLLFPKVDGLEDVYVGDTVSFNGRLKAGKKLNCFNGIQFSTVFFDSH